MNGRVRRQTRALAAGNLAGAALSFALFALIGRALGDAGLGIYATALAIVYPLSIGVEFGMGTLLVREAAGDAGAARRLLRPIGVQRAVMGGIATLLLIALAPTLTRTPEAAWTLIAAAPLVGITPLFNGYSAVLRVQERAGAVAALNVGMLAAQCALTVIALAAGTGVIGAMVVNTLTSAGQTFAAWLLLPRAPHPGALARGGLQEAVALLRRAVPYAVGGVLAAVSLRAPILLLELFGGAGAAGQFAVAVRFIDAAKLLPNALYAAMMPALAALSGDPTGQRALYLRSQRRLIGYGLLAGGALAVTAPLTVALVFGGAFAGAVLPLMVLGAGLAVTLARGGALARGYSVGEAARANRAIAWGLAVTIGTSLLLLPIVGIPGAAVAVLAGDAAVWGITARRAGRN